MGMDIKAAMALCPRPDPKPTFHFLALSIGGLELWIVPCYVLPLLLSPPPYHPISADRPRMRSVSHAQQTSGRISEALLRAKPVLYVHVSYITLYHVEISLRSTLALTYLQCCLPFLDFYSPLFYCCLFF